LPKKSTRNTLFVVTVCFYVSGMHYSPLPGRDNSRNKKFVLFALTRRKRFIRAKTPAIKSSFLPGAVGSWLLPTLLFSKKIHEIPPSSRSQRNPVRKRICLAIWIACFFLSGNFPGNAADARAKSVFMEKQCCVSGKRGHGRAHAKKRTRQNGEYRCDTERSNQSGIERNRMIVINISRVSAKKSREGCTLGKPPIPGTKNPRTKITSGGSKLQANNSAYQQPKAFCSGGTVCFFRLIMPSTHMEIPEILPPKACSINAGSSETTSRSVPSFTTSVSMNNTE
jgi:hypothetical protein